ncbi:hypothetical protein [Brucella intermedia]|uniref:hypothetical protein n=1 Tax=Brucella intermedia TaxID=94625 RepID=UPI0023615C04|nr:hypothetical protein [Brucella intermedia]
MTRTVLHQALSPDGQTRLVFFQRLDGSVTYVTEKFWIDDVPEYDYHAEYWAAFTDNGSIFDSLETAIRELRVEYPWLEPEKG